MAYEWDPRRARRARLMRFATAFAIGASALTVPVAVLFITASSPAEAKKISDALLKERLVACVSALPGVASRYWWKGKIESGKEILLIAKTAKSKVPAMDANPLKTACCRKSVAFFDLGSQERDLEFRRRGKAAAAFPFPSTGRRRR